MQQKKCRKCKEPKDISEFPKMNLGKYWVWSTCNNCLEDSKVPYELKRTQLKQSQTPINSVSKTNKNNIAKFTSKTKEEIKERDKVCILTWKPITDYHHFLFWPHQANYWPDRNNANQGVWLNSEPHRIIHHPSPKEKELAKIYRIKCIEYWLKL